MFSYTLKSFNAFQKLSRLPLDFSALTAANDTEYCIRASDFFDLHWLSSGISEQHLALFSELADEANIEAQFHALLHGEHMNVGENRAVMHHLLRADTPPNPAVETRWKSFYDETERAIHLAETIRASDRFDTILHIGIGGSALGPELLMEALSFLPQRFTVNIVSNVDPQALGDATKNIDLDRCLILIVSKSGSTQETAANFQSLAINLKEQVIAITMPGSLLDTPDVFRAVLYMDESVGGRYSISSPIGACLVSLVYGSDCFRDFLRGAASSDAIAQNIDLQNNAALFDAMLGVYYRNACEFSASAILPYVHLLRRLSAYLQQLDMESNGKQCSRDGVKLDYQTGPLVFGEPGTDAQHSFYQLLHQGTQIIPLQFIGMRKPLYDDQDTLHKHRLLNANLTAQIVAFARGQHADDTNKQFYGGRPSTLLIAEQMSAAALGSLIAHFENKVMFQGFLWNVNSFDQEGVQLGKQLTNTVLKALDSDPLLLAMAKRTGLV